VAVKSKLNVQSLLVRLFMDLDREQILAGRSAVVARLVLEPNAFVGSPIEAAAGSS